MRFLSLLSIAPAALLAGPISGQEAPAGSAKPAPPPVGFVHVAVVPMDREIVLPDQTVLVAEGRISALGPSAEVSVPEGARVIDGNGCFLMPGLADMHVHVWNEGDLLLFVANGVTAVRNMFGGPMHIAWRARVEAGELLGPRIHTAGSIIDGDPPVWPGSTVLTDPAKATGIVEEQALAGYDFLKPYARLSPECYDALAEAAAKRGLRLMGHVPESVDLAHVLSAGQRTIEHLNGWAEAAQRPDSPFTGRVDFKNEDEAWLHVDPEESARLAERFQEWGAWSCPTLVVLQKWVKGDSAKELLARPEMRFVSPMLRQSWSPESPWNYLAKLPGERAASARDSVPHRKRAVAALRAAGAGILAGTDTGNPYVVPGFSLHEELANLVDAGLSPYEALRAATSSAAECLEADWGVVAPGRRADLVLLRANPLEDVSHASLRRGVMVRGRWHAEEELSARLEARARSSGGTREEK